MKKTLFILGIVLSMLSVNAEDNVLQSIEIVPVKDTYSIVLVADKSVDVKKTVQAPNKITLDMKGIRASKTLNTVYNNVSNVDTVMVEPSGNGISLFFQAENAQNASVSFDTMIPAAAAAAKTVSQKQVKLNSPIDSYAPIYREDAAQSKTSSLFNKLTEKSNSIKDNMSENSIEVSDTMNKTVSYGLIGLLAFAVIRLFKRNKDADMKIGLTQSLNEREIDMYRGMQSVNSSYINPEKPFTTVNYGLNAYKKENQNPYETESMPIHNPRLRAYANQMAQPVQIQPMMAQPMVQRQSVATMPIQQPIRKNTTPVNTAPVNQNNPNVDNLKFLESMTAIYEKSGRHDLAQGLKASLTKGKIGA